jgi:hypothetical protein
MPILTTTPSLSSKSRNRDLLIGSGNYELVTQLGAELASLRRQNAQLRVHSQSPGSQKVLVEKRFQPGNHRVTEQRALFVGTLVGTEHKLKMFIFGVSLSWAIVIVSFLTTMLAGG